MHYLLKAYRNKISHSVTLLNTFIVYGSLGSTHNLVLVTAFFFFPIPCTPYFLFVLLNIMQGRTFGTIFNRSGDSNLTPAFKENSV